MNRDELAHELWAAAQLAPGEGISDAVARMNSLLAAQPAEAEGVELVPFWVLFDATTPEPLIKKHMPEGVLAFFDNEEDARRAKALHPGTDYKRAPYVRAASLSAVTAERDRLRAENERLARDAKNDAIAYRAVIERQEELRAELDAVRTQQGDPVAEIVKCEPYEDGSTNPHNAVNWFGRNAENDLPAGTKLYAAMAAKEA